MHEHANYSLKVIASGSTQIALLFVVWSLLNIVHGCLFVSNCVWNINQIVPIPYVNWLNQVKWCFPGRCYKLLLEPVKSVRDYQRMIDWVEAYCISQIWIELDAVTSNVARRLTESRRCYHIYRMRDNVCTPNKHCMLYNCLFKQKWAF